MADDLEQRLRALERSDAARERQDEINDGTIRALVTLPELYGRLDERVARIKADSDEAHDAIRDLDTRLDDEVDARRAGDEAHRQEIEAARAERLKQIARLEAKREKDRKDVRLRMMGVVVGLLTTLVTVAGGVVVAYLELLAAKGGK